MHLSDLLTFYCVYVLLCWMKQRGCTAMIWAAEKGHTSVVEFLHRSRADMDLQTKVALENCHDKMHLSHLLGKKDCISI